MNDKSTIERLLSANLYLVLDTADDDGQPWVSPVFDSTVAVGRAEAAYFDAHGPGDPGRGECGAARAHGRLPSERSYNLIRGGNREHGNAVDMTVEV